MDNWIKRFSSAKPLQGQERVIIPQRPGAEMETERMQHGIPLLQPVIDDLQSLADKFRVVL